MVARGQAVAGIRKLPFFKGGYGVSVWQEKTGDRWW